MDAPRRRPAAVRDLTVAGSGACRHACPAPTAARRTPHSAPTPQPASHSRMSRTALHPRHPRRSAVPAVLAPRLSSPPNPEAAATPPAAVRSSGARPPTAASGTAQVPVEGCGPLPARPAPQRPCTAPAPPPHSPQPGFPVLHRLANFPDATYSPSSYVSCLIDSRCFQPLSGSSRSNVIVSLPLAPPPLRLSRPYGRRGALSVAHHLHAA